MRGRLVLAQPGFFIPGATLIGQHRRLAVIGRRPPTDQIRERQTVLRRKPLTRIFHTLVGRSCRFALIFGRRGSATLPTNRGRHSTHHEISGLANGGRNARKGEAGRATLQRSLPLWRWLGWSLALPYAASPHISQCSECRLQFVGRAALPRRPNIRAKRQLRPTKL